MTVMLPFQPAWWCRNAHLQTIVAAVLRKAPPVRLARARWELPDGDFLDIDELAAGQSAPRLVVLHGLQSSSNAPAVRGLLREAARRGWGGIALNLRGCSGEPNRLRRSYHGGDTADLAWVIETVQARYPSSLIGCVGISLGGNILLKYLGERGDSLPRQIRGAVAISTPFDLALSARALEQRSNWVYRRYLVGSLKQETVKKLARYPDLVDRSALAAVRTMAQFDELVTAPVHGFPNAAAYWAASSSRAFLSGIRRPTLLINAEDDPFLPAEALPRAMVSENPYLTAAFTAAGGHIGFLAGWWPLAPVLWAEGRAVEFLAEHLQDGYSASRRAT